MTGKPKLNFAIAEYPHTAAIIRGEIPIEGIEPRLRSGEADSAIDRKYRELSQIVGGDPLPFGTKANLATMAALADTAFKQNLTPRRMDVREVFAEVEG